MKKLVLCLLVLSSLNALGGGFPELSPAFLTVRAQGGLQRKDPSALVSVEILRDGGVISTTVGSNPPLPGTSKLISKISLEKLDILMARVDESQNSPLLDDPSTGRACTGSQSLHFEAIRADGAHVPLAIQASNGAAHRADTFGRSEEEILKGFWALANEK